TSHPVISQMIGQTYSMRHRKFFRRHNSPTTFLNWKSKPQNKVRFQSAFNHDETSPGRHGTMQTLLERQRKVFISGHTLDERFRQKQLLRVKKMLKKFEKDIYQALKDDLNKSAHETLTTELGILYAEIDFVKKHLHEWMKPEQTTAPITHKGSKNMIYKEPYGVVCVMAPWNYPLQLAILPAIGAMAAGNTVII